MDNQERFYYKYSDYLKEKYGEKVYKLPINLPITCPNRIDGAGCIFCAEQGTGFEAMDAAVPVTEQLEQTKKRIRAKYHAEKFIAYFQNYTNTFMPLAKFRDYMLEAASVSDIVEISISTRPDCIRDEYLEFLDELCRERRLEINLELGLQTVNYHTLDDICRGHGIAEFIDAVRMIQRYPFSICAHVILNLPGDTLRDAVETSKVLSALGVNIVKIHSLYIAKNTRLCDNYEGGNITVCSREEYMRRLIAFLEYLDPGIVVERLFSRVPSEDAVFSNWGTSWWKLQDEVIQKMKEQKTYQGRRFSYLSGAALNKLQ